MINFLKFSHLVFILSLLGTTLYSVVSPKVKNTALIFWLSGLSILTGTLLVHPKHWTFHTEWIKAAYLFIFIFLLGIVAQHFIKLKNPALSRVFAIFLIIILCLVVRDAVTKTTLI